MGGHSDWSVCESLLLKFVSPSDWEQYEQLVGLYRFYLELAVKTSTGFWLIAGGVLTLVLANSDQALIGWALLIPIIMGLGLVVAMMRGRPKAIELRDAIKELSTTLELNQRTHAEILVWTGDGLLLAAIAAVLVLIVVLGASLFG